jgi:hypothetical protein
MAEGHMNIPEKETFGFFDEIGPKDEVLQRSHIVILFKHLI